MFYTTIFASAYGESSYNSNVYNNATSLTPTPTPSPATSTNTTPTPSTTTVGSSQTDGASTASSNVLANTGFDVLLAATLGSVIIFSALIIRFWKRPATKKD